MGIQMNYFYLIWRLLHFTKRDATSTTETIKSCTHDMQQSYQKYYFDESGDLSCFSKKVGFDVQRFPERLSASLVLCYSKILGNVDDVKFLIVIVDSLSLVLDSFPCSFHGLNESEKDLANNILAIYLNPLCDEEDVSDRFGYVLKSIASRCPGEIKLLVTDAFHSTTDIPKNSRFHKFCRDLYAHCSSLIDAR